MNWDAIGAVAELVAAVGVIASLIYLALQIRQNARSSNASTFQSVTSDAGQVYRLIAENTDVARIFRVGSANPEELDQDDLIRFFAIGNATFRSWENMFLQNANGSVDRESWEAWRRSIVAQLQLPGLAHFWQARGGAFRKDFQDFIASEAPPQFPAAGSGSWFPAA